VARGGLPHRSGIDAVVEEHHERGTPVPPHSERADPAAWSLHLVRREAEGVYLGLGQVVPSRHVPLVPRIREPRRCFDQLLFPRPGKDGAQVFAGLVRRATRLRPLLGEGTFVDPVDELADLLALQLLDWGATSSLLPFPDRGAVFIAGAACHGLGTEVSLDCSLEGRCHEGGSFAAGPGFDAESSWPAALN
jgi:hypothetical protein